MFTAQRYASVVYTVIVCLSIYLSQAKTPQRWLNTGLNSRIKHNRYCSGACNDNYKTALVPRLLTLIGLDRLTMVMLNILNFCMG